MLSPFEFEHAADWSYRLLSAPIRRTGQGDRDTLVRIVFVTAGTPGVRPGKRRACGNKLPKQEHRENLAVLPITLSRYLRHYGPTSTSTG